MENLTEQIEIKNIKRESLPIYIQTKESGRMQIEVILRDLYEHLASIPKEMRTELWEKLSDETYNKLKQYNEEI